MERDFRLQHAGAEWRFKLNNFEPDRPLDILPTAFLVAAASQPLRQESPATISPGGGASGPQVLYYYAATLAAIALRMSASNSR
jgi:hypothetical protein